MSHSDFPIDKFLSQTRDLFPLTLTITRFVIPGGRFRYDQDHFYESEGRGRGFGLLYNDDKVNGLKQVMTSYSSETKDPGSSTTDVR